MLIYQDVGKLDFLPEINSKYIFSPVEDFGLYKQPNGNKLNKYAVGSSLFQLPFFLAAAAYCTFDHTYPNDGYSPPYMRAHALSACFWVFIGLLILRAFLLRHFSDSTTAITLACIAFGTNIYCMAAFFPGGSHPYSFAVFAWVLYCSDGWYYTQKSKYLYLLALAIGLATLIRPISVLVIIVPLLWGIYSSDSLKDRALLLWRNRGKISLAMIFFFLVLSLQMFYWKYVTGHWVYYSYEGEYFNFLNPHIRLGLFSWRKGWFIYTPIAFVAMYGFYFLWKKDRTLVLSPLLFFVVFIYVIFSWHMWFYGGGFGCRPAVDALPIAAFSLAAFIEYTVALKQRLVRASIVALLSFFIILNMFQCYQYALGIIHGDRMTYEYYWAVFGKTKPDLESLKPLLIKDEDYGKDSK